MDDRLVVLELPDWAATLVLTSKYMYAAGGGSHQYVPRG